MDILCEQNVENPNIDRHRKRTTFLNVLRYVLLVIGILLAFFVCIGFTSDSLRASVVIIWLASTVLAAVPFVVSFFLIGKALNRSNTEYDYRLDGTYLRVIKVVRRNTRKLMTVVPVSAVESVGRVTCEAYERYSSSKNVKKLFAVCNYDDEDAIVYIRYRSEGEDYLLHIEPNEEMTTALKRCLPRLGILDKSMNVVTKKA